jgi:imidazolonepropionase-like amidohydrolase
MPVAARQLLMAGVTSARDLGARLDDILTVKRRIAAGEIAGPRLFVSGPFIQHAPYEAYEKDFRWGVTGADDARQKVQRIIDAGVDFVKLIDQDQMTDAEVAAVVETAHRNGKTVVAHAHRMAEIRVGLKHGVDGFEHTGLGTAPGYPEEVMAGIRERANTLYWTPTVSPLLLYEYTRDNPERIDDPRWKAGLPDDVVEDVGSSLEHLERLDYYQLMPKRRPTIDRKFAQLRESGVVMLVGTDSGVPLNFHSDATWRELDVWVNELGVPAIEAIRAATYWPAVAQGVADRVGTVAEGKVADVIAVRGDVLRHVALLQDVDVVIARGSGCVDRGGARRGAPGAVRRGSSRAAVDGSSAAGRGPAPPARRDLVHHRHHPVEQDALLAELGDPTVEQLEQLVPAALQRVDLGEVQQVAELALEGGALQRVQLFVETALAQVDRPPVGDLGQPLEGARVVDRPDAPVVAVQEVVLVAVEVVDQGVEHLEHLALQVAGGAEHRLFRLDRVGLGEGVLDPQLQRALLAVDGAQHGGRHQLEVEQPAQR